MNIIVLIKQVPDTTEIKIDKKTGNLIRKGVETIVNPYDLNALEAAVRLKETTEGKVSALSMGPPPAIEALSEAIGMGADQGVLLTDAAFAGADTWATAFTLGKAVEKMGDFDLIIAGRQAIDGDTAQVGPQLAEYLKIPIVTNVYQIEQTEEKSATVKRKIDDQHQSLKVPLPALITALAETNTPRYPVLSGLIDSCKKHAPLKIWNAADIGVKTYEVGLPGSLTEVAKTFTPKIKREGELLEGTPPAIVETLINRLKENQLI